MPADLHNRLAEISSNLTRLRKDLGAEISGYPTPISGCDAQFNHLLDLRQRVSEALSSLTCETYIPTPRWPDQPNRRSRAQDL